MPGGAADGTWSVAANEAGSFPNKPINVWGLDLRVAEGCDAIRSELIGE
jgi:hypothetical protein